MKQISSSGRKETNEFFLTLGRTSVWGGGGEWEWGGSGGGFHLPLKFFEFFSYPSHAFCDKFSDGQLLGIRDMTS